MNQYNDMAFDFWLRNFFSCPKTTLNTYKTQSIDSVLKTTVKPIQS